MLTDTSPMPFGKFAGKPMQDVPVEYMHWLWHGGMREKSIGESSVADYIRKNLDALKLENKDLIWS